MPTIEFRAWFHNPDNIKEGAMFYDIGILPDNEALVDGDIIDRDDKCIKIMQFTTYKDTHWEKIHVGDITRGADMRIYEIIDHNGCFGFWHWSIQDDNNKEKGFCPLYDLNTLWQEQIEVVGNIYEGKI